jgi:hypothetical protein
MKLLLVALPCVSGFFLGLRPAPAPSAQCHVRMMDPEATRDSEGSYEEYIADRASGKTAGGSIEDSAEAYAEFEKYNLDFDGGDSGGGVVGDGNTDLEDQHNSASIVRGGFGAASVGGGGVNVGRGNVISATDSKIASAGKNYFGRSTGYADKKLDELAEEQEKLRASGQSAKADLARHTMDCVRAQQMENWHNQRGIAKENRAAGQGVVYGAPQQSGRFDAQEALCSDKGRGGEQEGVELDQRKLANHMEAMRSAPTARLDGAAWEEATALGATQKETTEMRAPVGGVDVANILVKNEMNTFAPFQCRFTSDTPIEFSVTPTEGSMNRRSGAPTEVVVRFNPKEYGDAKVGTLIFETEDFKSVYSIIGST